MTISRVLPIERIVFFLSFPGRTGDAVPVLVVTALASLRGPRLEQLGIPFHTHPQVPPHPHIQTRSLTLTPEQRSNIFFQSVYPSTGHRNILPPPPVGHSTSGSSAVEQALSTGGVCRGNSFHASTRLSNPQRLRWLGSAVRSVAEGSRSKMLVPFSKRPPAARALC